MSSVLRQNVDHRQSPMLHVQDLEVVLSDGLPVVSDINFEISAGEVLALVGESGSGKTTIAMALLGYARPGARILKGHVSIAGTEILTLNGEALRSARGALVCHVAQNPGTALNPLMTIEAHLDDVLSAHLPGLDRLKRAKRIREILIDVGLPDADEFLRRFPHQLSGGQQQRVLLALAFILHPKLIVLDEPTTALDVTTQAKILDTLKRLCRDQQVAAIYVSHDLAVVKQVAKQVVVLYGGRIVEQASSSVLFEKPRHPYTQALIASIPDVSSKRSPEPIEGYAPNPSSRSAGCEFSSRCLHAVDACANHRPALLPQADDSLHRVACHLLAYPKDTNVFTQKNKGAWGIVKNREDHEQRPLLQVRGIFAAYDDRHVLFDVNLSIKPGECLAVVGESGSGKTTLARTIAGLGQNISGELRFQGDLLPIRAQLRPNAIKHQIQYIFQNPYQSLNPRKRIGQILGEVVRHFFRLTEDQVRDKVAHVLHEVSLPVGVAEAYPRDLSGGELQRVSIARALLCRPRLLICDEITSALDVSVQASILLLLKRLQQQGLAILFVTHNLGVVRSIADRVAVMQKGKIIEDRDAEQLFINPQAKYTQALIKDSPTVGHRSEGLEQSSLQTTISVLRGNY